LVDHDLDVKFIESNVGEILKAKLSKNGKVQCSLCAKLKKAIMVKEAKKMKINKIATGHHVDDAIETLFMNMINEGRLSTFQPMTNFDRNHIFLIRPFILCKEDVPKSICKKMNIPVIIGSCPNEFDTQRAYMKQFLKDNFYDNPRFKASLANFPTALLNGKQSALWFDDRKAKKQDLIKKMFQRV
jgi:tRNA(Ile)-lysidine synthase TilS/MesJ